jgi:diacylglycerol kinase family enzyme
MGTANVLAREIDLPRSPGGLAEALLDGEARTIPVGQVNGRPFLFVVGVGFDAEAVRIFEREGTRKLRQAGYVWPILRALLSYRDRPLRVSTPQGDSEGQWVIVTRTKRYAGSFVLAPEASLNEPKLYVLRITGNGALSRIRQLSALATGFFRYDPGVSLEATDRVAIEGDKSVPVQIDGETIGELPLTIGLHPQRLGVIFPAQRP